MGRFTSVDPEGVGAKESDPQSWNGYAYARNNPVIFGDPDGLEFQYCYSNGECYTYTDKQFASIKGDLQKSGFVFKGGIVYDQADGSQVATYIRTDTSALWDQVAPELSRRLEPVLKVAKVEAEVIAAFSLPVGGGGKLASLGLEAATTQAPRALLGTARMNLLSAVKNPKLKEFIEYLYRENATVGNGSTADAIRFERETGQLLSRAGHSIKGGEAIRGLEKLVRTGKLDAKDTEMARQIINDLKDSLK